MANRWRLTLRGALLAALLTLPVVVVFRASKSKERCAPPSLDALADAVASADALRVRFVATSSTENCELRPAAMVSDRAGLLRLADLLRGRQAWGRPTGLYQGGPFARVEVMRNGRVAHAFYAGLSHANAGVLSYHLSSARADAGCFNHVRPAFADELLRQTGVSEQSLAAAYDESASLSARGEYEW